MKNQKMFILIMAAVMVGALMLRMLAYIFT